MAPRNLRRYSTRDLKLLFARSGGVCAFRNCRRELTIRETNDLIAHIAHIVGHSEDGPRGEPMMPVKQRDAYENLLLLCPTHHAEVDTSSGSSRWTREELLRLKQEHEKWVADSLAVGTPVPAIVSQFSYINVPRLASLALLSGFDIDLSSCDDNQLLIDHGIQAVALSLAFQKVLDRIHLNAVSFEPNDLLDPSKIGVTTVFQGTFRTKNLPSIEAVRSGRWRPYGSIDKDPHVYRRVGSTQFVLPIDPKWILTITSWADFCGSGGQARLAGVCTIKNVDRSLKKIVGTPLFIGTPRSPYDGMFRDAQSTLQR